MLGRDHPRVCGGAFDQATFAGRFVGPSPRVRGSLSGGKSTPQNRGTIPACAGEPCLSGFAAKRRRDHPRVCGGASMISQASVMAMGPSPRVRGSQGPAVVTTGANGTIPACAGEPLRDRRTGREPGDHPRVCGGAPMIPLMGLQPQGPSPRVRGSRLVACQPLLYRGTIPACAGEPFRRQVDAAKPRDHPRVCGGARRTLPD
mgnify:CR=1 FL=1